MGEFFFVMSTIKATDLIHEARAIIISAILKLLKITFKQEVIKKLLTHVSPFRFNEGVFL